MFRKSGDEETARRLKSMADFIADEILEADQKNRRRRSRSREQAVKPPDGLAAILLLRLSLPNGIGELKKSLI